jgi:transcriptional regulator with XRE-family HTH domain
MKTGNKVFDNSEIYPSDAIAKNKERIKHREMLRESRKIALKVLMKLDDLGMKQRELAALMQVSPQQISKIVSGNENLTIETQIKLQNILNIPILASFYEKQGVESISMQPLNQAYHMTSSHTCSGTYVNPTQGLSQTMVIEDEPYFLEFETAS